MQISICIPCHGRAYDLAESMPYLIEAANRGAPAEIAVLDYNSPDDVLAVVEWGRKMRLAPGVMLTYNRYTGRDYYHLTHAWNLAVKCSRWRYVAIMGADAILAPEYLVEARKLIAGKARWMRGPHYKGIVIVERSLFYQLGGYDERMEFYGSEDRDLEARLVRSGAAFGLMPDNLVRTIRTPDTLKVGRYRLSLSKAEMSERNRAIYEENEQRGVITVNAGQEWGAWS